MKCFCNSYTGMSGDQALLSDLPTSCKLIDGLGVMINLTEKSRWQPFATWIIKLLNRCLTEGTLYVEGLVNLSFVSSACTLLCYGDADLQMVGSLFTMSWVLFHLVVYLMDLIHIIFFMHVFSYFNLWTHFDTVF